MDNHLYYITFSVQKDKRTSLSSAHRSPTCQQLTIPNSRPTRYRQTVTIERDSELGRVLPECARCFPVEQ